MFMRSIILILTILTAAAVAAAQPVDSVAVAPVDSVAVASMDSVVTKRVGTAVTAAVAAADTTHWFKELKRGKVDFESGRIRYPKFIRFVYNTVKLYHRILNNYDTTYVQGYGKKFRITLKNNNWLDNYDCEPFENTRIEFLGSSSSSIGLYLSALGLSLGYSIDVDRIVGKRSTSKKIEIGYNNARFNIEFFHMTNKGAMTMVFRDFEAKEKSRLEKFTGIRRKSWSLSANYFFNHRRYAHTSVYGCSKRQMKSAGTWMAGFRVSHQSFNIKVDELPQEYFYPEELEKMVDETMFEYTDYCLSGGYGYNWVLGPKWIINGTLQLFTGLKHAHKVSTSDGGRNFWSANGKVRVGVSYNHRSFFISPQAYLDTHFFNTGEYRFRSFLIDLTIITGFRF